MRNIKLNNLLTSLKGKFGKIPLTKGMIRLIIVLVFLFFVINSILPYLFREGDVTYVLEYDGKNVKFSLNILEGQKNRLESEKKSVDNLLLQKFVKENENLRDSLNNIAKKRMDDINEITDYINQLKIYKTLNPEEKTDLITNIAKFLVGDENLELDLGIIAQNLTFKEVELKLDSTMGLQATLFKENKRLICEIDGLKRDIEFIEKEKNKIKELYAETIEQLENWERLIVELEKGTFDLEEEIAFITKNRDDIKKRADRLEEDLKKVFPARVEGLSFKPINAKRRKDESYKLRNIKEGFSVSFKLNYNKPTSLKRDSVLIVYKIPNIFGEIIEKKQYKKVKLGSDVSFTFDDIKSYGKGLYIIQIIHEKSSKNIPLERREFEVK